MSPYLLRLEAVGTEWERSRILLAFGEILRRGLRAVREDCPALLDGIEATWISQLEAPIEQIKCLVNQPLYHGEITVSVTVRPER